MSEAAMKEKEEPKAKRLKVDDNEQEEEDQEDAATPTLRDSDGNAYFELSPKRRCTVKSWKGNVLVDVREFYEKDEEMRPGKKGISLTLDQYQTLKNLVNDGTIDAEIEKANSK